jgi:hypothetical protein
VQNTEGGVLKIVPISTWDHYPGNSTVKKLKSWSDGVQRNGYVIDAIFGIWKCGDDVGRMLNSHPFAVC